MKRYAEQVMNTASEISRNMGYFPETFVAGAMDREAGR
jgi:hypothetical protein